MKKILPLAYQEEVSQFSSWFFSWGIALTILGGLAIYAATFTTIASVVFIGFLITLCGSIVLLDTFTFWWGKWSGFLMHMVMSLVYIAVGLMLIENPLLASATLTLILGIFYLFMGLVRISYSLAMRVAKWQWTFVNGFISLLLGILIITNLPSASLFIIGLFVGLDILFIGLVYLMIGLTGRRIVSA